MLYSYLLSTGAYLFVLWPWFINTSVESISGQLYSILLYSPSSLLYPNWPLAIIVESAKVSVTSLTRLEGGERYYCCTNNAHWGHPIMVYYLRQKWNHHLWLCSELVSRGSGSNPTSHIFASSLALRINLISPRRWMTLQSK